MASQLLRGRIDLYPQELRVGLAELQSQLDPASAALITHSQTPFLRNDSFVMFPRKMPDSAKLRDQFNQQLQQAIASAGPAARPTIAGSSGRCASSSTDATRK